MREPGKQHDAQRSCLRAFAMLVLIAAAPAVAQTATPAGQQAEMDKMAQSVRGVIYTGL